MNGPIDRDRKNFDEHNTTAKNSSHKHRHTHTRLRTHTVTLPTNQQCAAICISPLANFHAFAKWSIDGGPHITNYMLVRECTQVDTDNTSFGLIHWSPRHVILGDLVLFVYLCLLLLCLWPHSNELQIVQWQPKCSVSSSCVYDSFTHSTRKND